VPRRFTRGLAEQIALSESTFSRVRPEVFRVHSHSSGSLVSEDKEISPDRFGITSSHIRYFRCFPYAAWLEIRSNSVQDARSAEFRRYLFWIQWQTGNLIEVKKCVLSS
jgi:hypothetical protein